MKGDFSRLRFGDWHRYATIMQQQGRVLLDSDWNASVTGISHRFREIGELLVGPRPGAGPADNLGFEIGSLRFAEFNTPNPDYPSFARIAYSPSLPFETFETVRETRIEITEIEIRERLELTVGDAALLAMFEEDFLEIDVEQTEHEVENPANPYTLSMDFSVVPEGESVILNHPGSFALAVDQDGHLHYSTYDGEVAERSARPVAPENSFRNLTLVFTGQVLVIYVDGHEVFRLPPPPLARANEDFPALLIGAFFDEDGINRRAPKTLRMAALRIWRCAIPGPTLRKLDRYDRKALAAYLVCDLDFHQLQGDEFADLSGFGNIAVAPRPDEVTFGFTDLTIGPGLYVVGGTVLSNPATITYRNQPFATHERDDPGAWEPGSTLVYLESFPRFVTPTEAPQLAEPALGGAQTTGRVEDVWQVRMLSAAGPVDCRSAFEAMQDATRSPGHIAMRHRDPLVTAPGNRLYRVEISAAGCAYDPREPFASKPMRDLSVPGWLSEGGRVELAAGLVSQELVKDSLAVVMVLWGEEYFAIPCRVVRGYQEGGIVVDTDGHHSWRDLIDHTAQAAIEDGRIATDYTEERFLDNVRIVPAARFRFSDENASVAFGVSQIVGGIDATGQDVGRVTLAGLREALADVAPGDWLELTNDPIALNRRAGPLYQVGTIDLAMMQLELRGWNRDDNTVSLATHDHPILRKWSVRSAERQAQAMQAAGVAPDALVNAPDYAVVPGRWTDLEHGIEARFSSRGWYARSSYWTAPTRDTGRDQLDWPGPRRRPALLPPQGPLVRRAPLAEIDNLDQKIHVSDVREVFYPLPGSEGSGGGHEPVHNRTIAQQLAFELDAFDRNLPPDNARNPHDVATAFWLDNALGGSARLLVPAADAGSLAVPGLNLVETGRVTARTLHALDWIDTDIDTSMITSDDTVPENLFDGPTRVYSSPDRQCLWVLSFEPVGPPDVPDYAVRPFDIWQVTRDAHNEIRWSRVPQTLRSAPDYLMACAKPAVLVLLGLQNDQYSDFFGCMVEPSGQTYPLGKIPFEVGDATAVRLGADIYITGGSQGADGARFVLRGETGEWDRSEPRYWGRTRNRFRAAVVEHGGCFYRFGGYDENGNQFTRAEVFDPRLPGWITRADLGPFSGRIAATSAQEGPILSDASSQVHLYRPDRDDFLSLAAKAPRANYGMGVLGREAPTLFAIGGQNRNAAMSHAALTQTHLVVK